MKSTVIHWILLSCALQLLCFHGLTDNARAKDPCSKPAQAVKGPIVMWSGKLADIPVGWRLCDGKLGTPDLRDRFIQGIRSGQEIGETGGAHTVRLKPSNLPWHCHTFTADSGGLHDHPWYDKYAYEYDAEPRGVTTYNAIVQAFQTIPRETDERGIHYHSGVTDNVGMATPFDNRPAYYRLAFITRPVTKAPDFPLAPGCIIIWSPAAKMGSRSRQTIPAGWKICDGSSIATPDLIDRFILGVQSGQDPGERGGTHDLKLEAQHLPNHTHPFQTDSGGNHDHGYDDMMRGPDYQVTYGGLLKATNILVKDEDIAFEITGDGGLHAHTGTTDPDGGGDVIDNRPAYLRLPYLMMISPTARIPERAIAIWSGELARIPAGWTLCDGTRGTPDLRDRFVPGGGLRMETGGSNQARLTYRTLARHSHSFVTDLAGNHEHELEDHWRMSSYVWCWELMSPDLASAPHWEMPCKTSLDGLHTHTGVTDPEGVSTPDSYDNRPAYYKAAFIMRI